MSAVEEMMQREIDRLRADSEGTRAVEYLRRARKAEAKIVRLTEWMAEHGLLIYHNFCRRPDGTGGAAWVVRTPAVVAGDSCEAWNTNSAAGAVDAWLAEPNVRAKPGAVGDSA